MASSSSALEVMGHNKQRLRISHFSGIESFPVYQAQLQQQVIFTFKTSMDPDCDGDFEALLKEIDDNKRKDAKEETAYQSAQVKKKSYQTDDYNFQLAMQASLKGAAYIIAFPQQTEFVLNKSPLLAGAKAYQRLLKEYGQIPVNVLDKFAAKQQILSLFTSPNLESPQLDVFLTAKVEEHIAKYKMSKEVANDLYLEVLHEFSQHLLVERCKRRLNHLFPSQFWLL